MPSSTRVLKVFVAIFSLIALAGLGLAIGAFIKAEQALPTRHHHHHHYPSPTKAPTTEAPTSEPTIAPTKAPTTAPTVAPTAVPTS